MCTAEAARSKIWLQPRRLATSWTFELPQTWVIKPTMTTSLWLHVRAASHSRRVHNSAANNRSMFKGKISSERWATRTLEFISRPTTFVPSSPRFRLQVPGRNQPFRLRPYRAENTPSRPIWQVKQRWARLVLGSETAWESRVL